MGVTEEKMWLMLKIYLQEIHRIDQQNHHTKNLPVQFKNTKKSAEYSGVVVIVKYIKD